MDLSQILSRVEGLTPEQLGQFMSASYEREDRMAKREDLRLQHEREEREKERAHELELASRQAQVPKVNADDESVKIPPFQEGLEDIDSYIMRFEKIARFKKWREDSWALH